MHVVRTTSDPTASHVGSEGTNAIAQRAIMRIRHLRACAPGMRVSRGLALLRAALMLNALLRDKHEGLNRGNADPPIAW